MNFLVDIIPPTARRYVYGAIALLGLCFTVWQASDGDWKTALATLVGSMVTALAHANTSQTNDDEPPPSPTILVKGPYER